MYNNIVNSNSQCRYTNKLYCQGTENLNIGHMIEIMFQKSEIKDRLDKKRRGGICPIHHIYYNYNHHCDLCE